MTEANDGASLVLRAASAARLARAQRAVGRLEASLDLWEYAKGYTAGNLEPRAAADEARFFGLDLDLEECLALGPDLDPSRPGKGLRFAVGILRAWREMTTLGLDASLTPSLMSRLFWGLEAPDLARGGEPPADELVDGAGVWTLAPRWAKAGLPALWACGLAVAAWERDGPDHPLRHLAGRVFAAGLGARLGLPLAALAGIGPHLDQAAARMKGGLAALLLDLRSEGNWRGFLEVWFAAAASRADSSVNDMLAARDTFLAQEELIATWVRAPKNAQRFLALMLSRPVVDLPTVADSLEVTQRTAGLLADKLVELALIQEITGQKRGRRYTLAPPVQAE